ncbi:MAG: DUF4296 domain-containing protein [Bacteroidota bacterium]|nr:DUF4296 domain-containing protein [Bacteroidota bacterium]
MKGILFYFPLLFSLITCNSSNRTPDNLIKEDEMVEILIRIHLSEAKSSHSYMAPDSALMVYANLEDSIFARYKTNKKDFETSYAYYLKNIDKMDQIYMRVVDSLALREAVRNVGY